MRSRPRHGPLLLALLAASSAAQDAPAPPPALTTAETVAREADHWRVEHIPSPPGAVLEVGGMDWLPDGRLVVSTRRGQVWLVDGALADDPADTRFTLYAEGLQEGLGLNVLEVPDGAGGTRHALYVLQRSELTELRDDDGDGRAERWITVADGWGLSGNYHEFAFGLPDDGAGRLYMSLNVAFMSAEWWVGKAVVPWRGFVLRVDPLTGATEPVAHGFRSPAGLTIDNAGRLLVTDNQGDWMPAGPVFAVREGAFHGHPASLDWTPAYREHGLTASLMQPPAVERAPAAIWLPYGLSRSAGNLAPIPADGSFGPFADQLVLAELTNGHLLRVMLEDVQGVTQGAVVPLRQRVGSVFRVAFAPDGTLFGGMTNRGWGGLPPDHGLLRVRATAEVPFEVQRLSLVPGGFRATFTAPLAEGPVIDAASATVVQHDYDWWWEYGSPERRSTPVPVTAVELSPDRRTLVLRTPELRAGMVARVAFHGLRDNSSRLLLHNELAYTVNQLADGPLTTEHVAKVAVPPPPKDSNREGWLRLTYGDALDAMSGEGWELVEAELHPDDRAKLLVRAGNGALVPHGDSAPGPLTSRWDFGSGRYHLEVMLPEGGRVQVLVAGRYGVELVDDSVGLPAGSLGNGALLPGLDGSPGRAPDTRVYTGAGYWHKLDLDYEAPQFGHMLGVPPIERGRWREISIDGTVVHCDVELAGPSQGGLTDHRSSGPLVIVPGSAHVALRTVEFRPAEDAGEPSLERDWVPLFTGDDLASWPTEPAGVALGDDPDWELVDGELSSSGPRSWLLSPRAYEGNLEVRAEVLVSDGGMGALLVRAQNQDGAVTGYRAPINSSIAGPEHTGGLSDLVPRTVELIPPDTWCELELSVRDEAGGVRLRLHVNDVLVADHLDAEARHGAGHVALEQREPRGRLRVRNLQIRVD